MKLPKRRDMLSFEFLECALVEFVNEEFVCVGHMYRTSALTLQENHKIETNFKDKK